MSKEIKSVLMTAGVFLLVASVLGWFVYDNSVRVEELTATNQGLETEIKKFKDRAAERESMEKKLVQLQNAVKEYVKILPNPEIATEEQIIKTFSDYSRRANIRIDEILRQSKRPQRARRGAKRPKKTDFEEKKVQFRIKGQFDEFVRFLNFIERDESFLQVRSFSLTAAPPEQKEKLTRRRELNVLLTVSTFRYNAK